MAEVSVPGVGAVPKRALLIGGGVAALVMGVLWWRKRQVAAAVTPAPTTDPNAVDPNAFASGSGGVGSLSGAFPTAAAPATNPQWTAQVMAALGGVDDPNALAAALGAYLTGGAVTTAQESLIDQAIATAGYPPVAGPGGYPPAIHSQPAGGGGGIASVPGAVTGLRATTWGATWASFTWAPTPNATSYVISQPDGSTREVGGTEATVGAALGGNVHFPYTFSVKAKNANGTGPAAHTTIQSAGGTH